MSKPTGSTSPTIEKVSLLVEVLSPLVGPRRAVSLRRGLSCKHINTERIPRFLRLSHDDGKSNQRQLIQRETKHSF
jgi:hypothetical protein